MTATPLARVRRPAGLFLVAAAALASACGGGAATSSMPVRDLAVHGRVALGALAGATVTVYRVGDYDHVLATATTSGGDTWAEVGRFALSLSGVPADATFLFVVRGGEARDANEDGTADGPTPNLGTIHALATAAQLDGRDVLVSEVTEVVYRRVRYFLEAAYPESYVAEACDAWTTFVLRSSIDGDAAIDNRDALAFDPRLHASATFRPYASRFVPFADRVLEGDPATEDAFALSAEEIRFEDVATETVGVDLVGNLAYVCAGEDGLQVWDVANPTAPVRIGAHDTPGYAMAVQVVGTRAYVADDSGDLQIVDVTVPTAPVLVGAITVGGPVQSLHVVESRAYLCTGDMAVLRVVNVANPAAPVLLGIAVTDAPATCVRVRGHFAYLLEAGQIETVDVADPTQPDSLGTVPCAGSASMDLGIDHLFVESAVRFEVFSLATPTAPQSIASLALPEGSSSGLRVTGTQAFLPRGGDGILVVDVGDPAQPGLLGVLPTSGSVMSVDQDGGLLFFTEGTGGVGTVGAGRPAPSGVVASLPRASTVDAVDAVGSRVVVATSGPSELVVVDVGNPLAPTVLGSVPLVSSSGRDLVVQGNLAFVGEEAGLQVYGVANPAAPVRVGGDDVIASPRGLAVGQNVVYAAAGDRVAVYDVSAPAQTHLLRWIPVGGTARGLAFDTNHFVVASADAGALVFDAIVPTTPTMAGQIDMSVAVDVALRTPYAFVAQASSSGVGDRLNVLDVSLLGSPTLVASVLLPGGVDRVVRSSGYLYASAGVGGVNVVDAGSPDDPVHVGTIPLPTVARDIDVEGGWVFVASDSPNGALLVLRAWQVEVP